MFLEYLVPAVLMILSVIPVYLIGINCFMMWADPDMDFKNEKIPTPIRITFLILSIVIVVCLTQALFHIF